MYTVQPTRRNHSHRSNVDEGVSTMGGGFHGCDVLILAFLLTSYVQNLSTANLCGWPIFVVGSEVFGK